MVLAGSTEDKPFVAERAEWAGVGISLRTGEPSSEQIKHAIDQILSQQKYRQRIDEIKKEIVDYNCHDILEDTIKEMVYSSYVNAARAEQGGEGGFETFMPLTERTLGELGKILTHYKCQICSAEVQLEEEEHKCHSMLQEYIGDTTT